MIDNWKVLLRFGVFCIQTTDILLQVCDSWTDVNRNSPVHGITFSIYLAMRHVASRCTQCSGRSFTRALHGDVREYTDGCHGNSAHLLAATFLVDCGRQGGDECGRAAQRNVMHCFMMTAELSATWVTLSLAAAASQLLSLVDTALVHYHY